MSLLRRSATGVVAVFAIALAIPAPSANAASKGLRFETLSSVVGGKVQACRVPNKTSKPVKIRMRVDARQASGRVSGGGQATLNGSPVGKGWKSGWVRKGQRSEVGTVYVPRGAAYALNAGIGAGQMGDGGSFTVASIRTCR